MTKAEERSILEQMRKMSEGTFYIAETFKGIWEIASRNIDDDSVCNPVEARQYDFEQKLKEDAEHGRKILALECERDVAVEHAGILEEKVAGLEHMIDSKDYIIAELNRDVQSGLEEVTRLRKLVEEQAELIRNMKCEIYDLERR